MASFETQGNQITTATTAGSTLPIPSGVHDEVDDAALSFQYVWAYLCKLLSCPDYGKSWGLRSNFLLHSQEREAHMATAATPAARRAIEVDRHYATDPHLPPRAAPDFRSQEDPEEQIWTYSFKDNTGTVLTCTGTQRSIRTCRNRGRKGGVM
jgi:hypothetical protein